MNNANIIKVDHCPPGFSSNIGSNKEWQDSYRKWLAKRGFFDELRAMDIASRRSPAFRGKKKQEEPYGTD